MQWKYYGNTDRLGNLWEKQELKERKKKEGTERDKEKAITEDIRRKKKYREELTIERWMVKQFQKKKKKNQQMDDENNTIMIFMEYTKKEVHMTGNLVVVAHWTKNKIIRTNTNSSVNEHVFVCWMSEWINVWVVGWVGVCRRARMIWIQHKAKLMNYVCRWWVQEFKKTNKVPQQYIHTNLLYNDCLNSEMAKNKWKKKHKSIKQADSILKTNHWRFPFDFFQSISRDGRLRR